MQPIDFFAVGDVVVDAFIMLKDAQVHCKINNEECEICMRWADKIPYEEAIEIPAVGNAANAAVSAARLGIGSALRAYVGDDENGEKCLRVLKTENVLTDFIEKVPGKHTNYHYALSFQSERTILIKHEQFDYSLAALSAAPRWFYLSSLGENSLAYHQALIERLAQWPNTKLAFQPGTFQMKMGKDALAEVYRRSDIFFCNKEEAELILGMSAITDIKKLLSAMQALGPKIVCITDGRNGAYALAQDGTAWFIPMYPDERAPKERTGAGDAFASTVTVALALGKPLEEALLWGPINAMEVVQEIGAQKGLLHRDHLEEFLKNAPKEYVLTKL